jgi:hypothetical protein
MKINLAIDFIIGFMSFIGDFADVIYKYNTRNTVLLENKLRKRGGRRLKDVNRRYKVDLSLPEIYNNTFNENFAYDRPSPRYKFRKELRRPKGIYNSPNTRNGGWFGGRSEAEFKS